MNQPPLDDMIHELLERWEDSHEQGEEISAEELCAEHPELLPVVKRRINALKATSWLNAARPDSDEEDHETGTHSAADTQYGTMAQEFPEKLGRYVLLNPIGSGGFAQVFRGFDPQLQRAVAIKVPHLSRMQGTDAINKMLDEARKVAHLKHPGIVPIYDAGRDEEYCYIVSELIRGSDLSRALKKRRPKMREAIRIVSEVAEILNYAHERGFVHRDIKPANILLDQKGRPYLTDFGIAVSSHQIRYEEDKVLGTVGYMSPEQLRGNLHHIDARTDIYSLGVVLFRLLTGELPNLSSLSKKLPKAARGKEGDLPPQKVLSQHNVPKPLALICLKCLQKKPDYRYSTAGELHEALRHMLESPSSSTIQQPKIRKAKASPQSKKKKSRKSSTSIPRQKKKTDEEFEVSEVSEEFDPYHSWLGILPEEHPVNDYRLLGLDDLEDDPEVIRAAADQQMNYLHQVAAGPHSSESQQLLNEIAAAKVCLLNPETKADYDEQLRKEPSSKTFSPSKPRRRWWRKEDFDEFDPYHKWLGIPKHLRPPTYYQLLAISPTEQSDEVIITAATRRGNFVQEFKTTEYAEMATTLLYEIEEAKASLLNFRLRREYDESLAAKKNRQQGRIIQNWIPGYTPAATAGEDPDFVRTYAGIMSILLAGFIIMAVVSFALPWRKIVFDAPEQGQQQANDGAIGLSTIAATISNVNASEREITVSRNSKRVVLEINKATKFSINGQPASLDSLSPGQKASVTFNPEYDIVVKVEVLETKSESTPSPSRPNDTADLATIDAEISKPKPSTTPVATNKTLTNSIGMKLSLIPAGEFLMGSPEDEEDRDGDEGPQHRVRITKPFYLQTTEVTQAQWQAVMGTTPWKGNNYVKSGADYAASWVSWNDAQEFCKKLSQKEGSPYRLPTEAEWEYACRAGSTTIYGFGDHAASLGEYAWYDKNAWDVGEEYAHRVGLKKPNAWGLFDMHGNVWEWCQDWFDKDYYKNSPPSDPVGPGSSAGSSRVLRGGGWGSEPQGARSAVRGWVTPVSRVYDIGFRVVRVAE